MVTMLSVLTNFMENVTYIVNYSTTEPNLLRIDVDHTTPQEWWQQTMLA